MDCSLSGSSIHGILQARILEWVAMPSSRGSSQPRDQTQVSHIAGGFFIIWATKARMNYYPSSSCSSKYILIHYERTLLILQFNWETWVLWQTTEQESMQLSLSSSSSPSVPPNQATFSASLLFPVNCELLWMLSVDVCSYRIASFSSALCFLSAFHSAWQRYILLKSVTWLNQKVRSSLKTVTWTT